jgi:hypothetical protein
MNANALDGSFSISPFPKKVAYVAKSSGKKHVVADGMEQDRFDKILGYLWRIKFSPASKRMACYGQRRGDWVGVPDGREINGLQPIV